MAYLLDTNVLIRLANTADASHTVAVQAVLELHRLDEILHVTAQVLIEFRNVATRPQAVNGLGLSPMDAEALASGFEAAFPLLPETPDIFPAWKALVESLGVVGKQVHDARLVAICHTHRESHLLTFNAGHFARLANAGPGLIVVEPADV
jgi:predicted nucleic acid-binding protein